MKPEHLSAAVHHRAAPDLSAVTTCARGGADALAALDAEDAAFLEENRRELERFTREIDEVLGPIFDADDMPQMSPPCARTRETED